MITTGDSKVFTAVWNLQDNFTNKYQGIRKYIAEATDTENEIKFSVNDNEVIKKTQDMGGKIAASTNGMTSSVEKYTSASKTSGDVQKNTNDAIKKGSDEVGKHKSAIEQLQGKYQGFTDSLGKLKTALAGVFTLMAGGAIAGFTWKSAEDSAQYRQSVMTRLSQRTGSSKIDTAALGAFVDNAKDSGYAFSTDRLQLANLMVQRGAKNTGAAIGATTALEKVFFRDRAMLEKDYGVTSAQDLGDLATTKMIRGDTGKQLDYLFGKGFSKLSQTSRINKLQKMGVDIDINAVMADRPLEVIENRMKSIGKSIGNEFRGPMREIAGLVANILGIIDTNPILPKIVALGGGLAVVVGTLITIVGLLPIIKNGISSLNAGFQIIGKAGLLSNPLFLLAGIAAIILVILYKTGVLQKAWEKFNQSAIGKDIIGALQGIAGWVGGIIDQFAKWYEVSGKNDLLEMLYEVVGVLGQAWDLLDGLYSTMKSGGSIGFKILQGASNGNREQLLSGISDLIGGLFNLARSKFPFLDKIYEVLKKTMDIFSWIWNMLQGFWSWIQQVMPGAKKESARKPFQAELDKYGLIYQGEGNYVKRDLAGGVLKYNMGNIADLLGVDAKGQAEKSKIFNLQEKFDKAPGMWDDLLSAIKELTTAILNWGKTKMQQTLAPVITPAANYVNSNLNEASQIYQANKARGLGEAPSALDAGYSETPMAKGGKALYDWGKSLIWGNQDNSQQSISDRAANMRSFIDQMVSSKLSNSDIRSNLSGAGYTDAEISSAGYASGASFKRGGIFRGLVHAPEELINQATAIKGPGVLAKSIDALDSIINGKPSAFGAGAGPVEVHVHNQNDFDFSGAKIEKDANLEAFFRQIDGRITKASVEAVRDVIGNRR